MTDIFVSNQPIHTDKLINSDHQRMDVTPRLMPLQSHAPRANAAVDFTGFRLFLIQEKKDSKSAKRGLHTVGLHITRLQFLVRLVPDLSVAGIREQLLALYQRNRKGRYLNLYIHTLHVYGRFTKTSCYNQLEYFPEAKINKAVLSDSEIEAFLNLPPPITTRFHWKSKSNITYVTDPQGWKIRTLFWKIFAFSGMRPGEVAHLKKESIDFKRGVFIANGKTGERFVPIAPTLVPELQEYIRSLPTDSLFHQRKNNFMTQSTWGQDFRQRIKRLDIKREGLTPHSLRHSFISRLLGEDVNLFKVQKIVGHRRITTTAMYEHLATKDIVTAIHRDPLSRRVLAKNEKILMRRKALEESGCIVVGVRELENGHVVYETVDE